MFDILILVLCLGTSVFAGAAKDFKDQYCTDPRTMQKHAAYTEWADAYSCTRHRCQPGGRNLAIYTVGCKRVEAPESAIECEEVVEDTNMQFPFCCTRLRCLVVVRGEVWTRVLGQPWETLPAAPWSHMYKMKRPPPAEFESKSPKEGPVYELGEEGTSTGNMRSKKTDNPQDCDDTNIARTGGGGAPDIVIALETNNDRMMSEKYKRARNTDTEHRYFEEVPTDKRQETERLRYNRAEDIEETATEKNVDEPKQQTSVPEDKWNAEISAEVDNAIKEHQSSEVEPKESKPSKLQELVDAIGTRMRDIEDVVQKMSGRVAHENDIASKDKSSEKRKAKKKPNPNGDKYMRFPSKTKQQKHSRKSEATTDDVILDDEQNGYYSDAVNSILRRNEPKEPQRPTYMAPIDNRRKHHKLTTSTEEKKHKKHSQKKKKGKHHKKHHDKRKKNSVEVDRYVLTIEDSSGSNVIV